jgi:hypothetical protein
MGDRLLYHSTLFHVSEYISHLCLLGQRELPWGLLDRSDLASVDVVVHSVGSPTVAALGRKDVTKLDNQVLQLPGLFVTQVSPGAGNHDSCLQSPMASCL